MTADDRDLHAGDGGGLGGADEEFLEAGPREHDVDGHARRLVDDGHDAGRGHERVVEREGRREA